MVWKPQKDKESNRIRSEDPVSLKSCRFINQLHHLIPVSTAPPKKDIITPLSLFFFPPLPRNTFKLFSSAFRRFPSLRSIGLTATAATTVHQQSPPSASVFSKSFPTPSRVNSNTARMVHSKVVSKWCLSRRSIHPTSSDIRVLTALTHSYRLRPWCPHCRYLSLARRATASPLRGHARQRHRCRWSAHDDH